MHIPNVPQKLKDRAIAKVVHYVRLVEEELYFDFPEIEVTFNPCGTDAGLAYFDMAGPMRINLNPELLIRDPKTMIGQIVGHEVAHLASMYRYGSDIQPHGKEWQEFMDLFDLEPEVKHNISTVGMHRRTQTYKHVCKCPDRVHEMSSIANRYIMQQCTPAYVCQQCGSKLRPQKKPSEVKGLPKKLQYETKVNKAEWVVKKYVGRPRRVVIEKLMQLAGLTEAGASTYYRNLSAPR